MKLSESCDPTMVILDHLREEESKSAHVDLYTKKENIENEMLLLKMWTP